MRFTAYFLSPRWTASTFASLLSTCVVSIAFAAQNLTSVQTTSIRPNILVIYTDDLGFGDVGCYGATKVRTPHIDRLAREGRRFTDAHSVSAVCTPSRYALLTGEYPFRINSFAPVFSKAGLIIDPAKMTVARLLQRQNYATTCIGKWHLGLGDKTPDWNGELKPSPLEVGFDSFFGLPTVNSHSPFVLVENHRVIGQDAADPLIFGGVPPTKPYPEKVLTLDPISGGQAAHNRYQDEQLGTEFAARAVSWLRDNKDRPFFLYFATPQIHHPFTPHPRFRGTSECGLYGDFIHELDWMVGELLTTLDELKIAENTLVIFTSDNGGMLNLGGQAAWKAGHRANGEWLGFKFGAWEGGHRVPFIARWPGRIPAGTMSDALIANVDLLATVAAITGQKLEAKEAVDSCNILPALTGSPWKPIRDHLVIAAMRPANLSLRAGHWMYISAQGDGGFAGVRGGPGSIAFSGRSNSDITPDGKIKPDAPAAQLYDLATDPGQTTNVIARQPEVASRLAAQLQEYRASARTAPLP